MSAAAACSTQCSELPQLPVRAALRMAPSQQAENLLTGWLTVMLTKRSLAFTKWAKIKKSVYRHTDLMNGGDTNFKRQ